MAGNKKIHINDLESRGGCEKLERDGITREQISKQMYKLTDGMTQSERGELYRKLYDREKYHVTDKGRWI